MAQISFDPARKLNIYFRVARDGSKTFSFVDTNRAGYDISGHSFEIQVKYKSTFSEDVISFANGDLTRPNNYSFTVPMTVLKSTVAATEYYWQLNVTLPDTSVKTWLTGSAIFHNGEFDGVTETTSFTIDESAGITLTINDTVSPIASTQSQVNAGTASGFVNPATLNDYAPDIVALTDAATIDITGSEHTLTTATGRTFTVSHAGAYISVDITLNATSEVFTFPAGSLCSIGGTASGDNTITLSGTSGDLYTVGLKKKATGYLVLAQNMGQ